MRRHLITAALSLSFLAAVPIMASAKPFENSITEPLTAPVKIEVVIGEDLAYRAEHLPKKMSDRSSNRFNAAFSNNGFYGERDVQRLAEKLQSKVEDRFTKEGIEISDDAATVLRITLTDAKPNRPTFKQLGKEPGLSYRSFGIGGATIESELIAAGGTSLGAMNYKWYENDIRDAYYGGTWSDAHRAMGRYARKAAKTLAN